MPSVGDEACLYLHDSPIGALVKAHEAQSRDVREYRTTSEQERYTRAGCISIEEVPRYALDVVQTDLEAGSFDDTDDVKNFT